MVVLGCLLGVLGGAVAGWFGRRLLDVLPRGVPQPAGWCEVGVGALWAVVALRTSTGALPPGWAPVPVLLGWLAVLLVGCDLRAARLPDALTLPAWPAAFGTIGLAAWLSDTPTAPRTAVLGSAIYAGGYAIVRWIAPRSMGAGDVKLAGSLGAFAGAVSVSSVLLAMLAAAVLTLAFAGRSGGGIPHGPAMLAPVWLITVFGG